jgi:hypothetical protein
MSRRLCSINALLYFSGIQEIIERKQRDGIIHDGSNKKQKVGAERF